MSPRDSGKGARPALIRTRVIVCGVVVAIVLYFLGGIFSVNGDTWEWWIYTSLAAAVVTLAVSIWIAIRLPGRTLQLRRSHLVGMVSGFGVVVTTTTIMARRYNDSWEGSLLWPHVLACLALASFTLALVSFALAIVGAGRVEKASRETRGR